MEELFKQFSPLIKKYAYLYRNYEDSYSEACLLFCEAVKTFDKSKGVPFEGYAMSKIKWGKYNNAKYRNKRNAKVTLFDPNVDNLEEEMKIDYDPYLENPEVKLVKKQDITLINNAIKQLTPKQQEVVLATITNNETLIDVSRCMGITVQGVFNLRNRGLSKIKKHLLKSGYDRSAI